MNDESRGAAAHIQKIRHGLPAPPNTQIWLMRNHLCRGWYMHQKSPGRRQAGGRSEAGRYAAVRTAIATQLSKNTAGDLSNPAQTGRGCARSIKIFLLFPLSCQSDNQGLLGGMTTSSDKKHQRRFFGKDDSIMAPEGRWPDPELFLLSS